MRIKLNDKAKRAWACILQWDKKDYTSDEDLLLNVLEVYITERHASDDCMERGP
jgi:hypothetical protein